MTPPRASLFLRLAREAGAPFAVASGGRMYEAAALAPAPIQYRRADRESAPVAAPAPPVPPHPAPTWIDIERISDEVIRRIERSSQIERVRRGII